MLISCILRAFYKLLWEMEKLYRGARYFLKQVHYVASYGTVLRRRIQYVADFDQFSGSEWGCVCNNEMVFT